MKIMHVVLLEVEISLFKLIMNKFNGSIMRVKNAFYDIKKVMIHMVIELFYSDEPIPKLVLNFCFLCTEFVIWLL